LKFAMQKAILLAVNMKDFTEFVQKLATNKSGLILDQNKLYQVKLWMEEHKFRSLAEEILRINRFEWDEKYTLLLVNRFWKGFMIIHDYVEYHYSDLFILTARLHTLRNLSEEFILKI